MTAPINPKPCASAQEIAERAARKVTAEFFGITEEQVIGRLQEPGYQVSKGLHGVALSAIAAAVAQAKEEDTARLSWLNRHWFPSHKEFRKEIDSAMAKSGEALELKEPATESNLAIQNARELLRVAEIELTLLSDSYGLVCKVAKVDPEYRDASRNQLVRDIQRFLSEHSNAVGAAQVLCAQCKKEISKCACGWGSRTHELNR